MAQASTRRYLAGDERLVIEVRRHPIVIAGPLALSIFAIAAASMVGLLITPAAGNDLIDTIVGAVAICFVFRFVWRMWQWWLDRIVVTDKRFLEVSGIFTRKVATMPLSRVTDLTYRRTIAGRLFGYGDLIIESAGQDQGLARLERLPDPDHFYRTVTILSNAALTEVDIPQPFTGWGVKADEEDTGPLPRVIV